MKNKLFNPILLLTAIFVVVCVFSFFVVSCGEDDPVVEPVVEDERAAAVGFKLKGLLIGGDNILDNERDGDAYTLFALLPSTLSVNMDYSIGDKSVLDDIDVVIDGEAIALGGRFTFLRDSYELSIVYRGKQVLKTVKVSINSPHDGSAPTDVPVSESLKIDPLTGEAFGSDALESGMLLNLYKMKPSLTMDDFKPIESKPPNINRVVYSDLAYTNFGYYNGDDFIGTNANQYIEWSFYANFESDNYNFRVIANDAVRVRIDGQQYFNGNTPGEYDTIFTVKLDDSSLHFFQIETYNSISTDSKLVFQYKATHEEEYKNFNINNTFTVASGGFRVRFENGDDKIFLDNSDGSLQRPGRGLLVSNDVYHKLTHLRPAANDNKNTWPALWLGGVAFTDNGTPNDLSDDRMYVASRTSGVGGTHGSGADVSRVTDKGIYEVTGWRNATGRLTTANFIERDDTTSHDSHLGLVAAGNRLYVTLKTEILYYEDKNGDGDFDDPNDKKAVTVINSYGGGGSHEYTFSLATHSDINYIYGAVSTAQSGAEGGYASSTYTSSIFRFPKNTTSLYAGGTGGGGRFEVYASGTRTPLGVGLVDLGGTDGVKPVYADNQGNYYPTSPVTIVNKGDYLGYDLNHGVSGWPYGYYQTNDGTSGSTRHTTREDVTYGTIWSPHGYMGRCVSQPIQLTNGPHAGDTVVLEYVSGGIRRAIFEKVNNTWQGTYLQYTGGRIEGPSTDFMESGPMRGDYGPDGNLYITLLSTGTRLKGIENGTSWYDWNTGGLEKLELVNGDVGPTNIIEFRDISLVRNEGKVGFKITFNFPVYKNHMVPALFSASQWTYRISSVYGVGKVGEVEANISGIDFLGDEESDFTSELILYVDDLQASPEGWVAYVTYNRDFVGNDHNNDGEYQFEDEDNGVPANPELFFYSPEFYYTIHELP